MIGAVNKTLLKEDKSVQSVLKENKSFKKWFKNQYIIRKMVLKMADHLTKND